MSAAAHTALRAEHLSDLSHRASEREIRIILVGSDAQMLKSLRGCPSEARTLRRRVKGATYNRESRRLRNRILEIVGTKVKDGAVAGFFDIFKKKKHRLFQWVAHPEVPAENNLAERRLRPLVIARKVSFGSQSVEGLRIRETLLTVMDTLRLRWDDPVGKLMEAFEAIAADPDADITDILFPKKPPNPPKQTAAKP